MLRSVNKLNGYMIKATDGDIGQVEEFFFDDATWTIRYLAAKTGGWFTGEKVLLSPAVLGEPDWSGQVFPVMLTRKQVEESPPVDMDKPVSRQKEAELHTYYNLSPYWSPAGLVRPGYPPVEPQRSAVASVMEQDEAVVVQEDQDPNLRSSREISGYTIHASDGDIGHVEDFLVDDKFWIIRYMIIDTRNWLPGRKVLVAPDWIERFTWTERKVDVNMTRREIKDSPEYDPSTPFSREYEEKLFNHYNLPFYWT